MYTLEMIGASSEGIGFGNLSARSGNTPEFYISGTATGSYRKLGKNHYCLVKDFDIQQNRLSCTGPVRASSESMTHAVIYRADPRVGAIFHIHHAAMWSVLIGRAPTTPSDAEYGTPEMALALTELMNDPVSRDQRIAVMGGHQDGIIFWGADPDETGSYLLSYYNMII